MHGRSTRGIGGNEVIREIGTGLVIGNGTNGDDLAGVTRAGDGEVAVTAVVAGRNHHGDAGVPHGLGGQYQRVIGGLGLHGLAK